MLLVNLGGPSLDPNFHLEILETLSLVGHIPAVQNGARDAGFGGLVALLSSGDMGMQIRAAKCVVKLCQVNGTKANAFFSAAQ